MSILIKGEAMPYGCMDCKLSVYDSNAIPCYCRATFDEINYFDFNGDKPEWCPLVEITDIDEARIKNLEADIKLKKAIEENIKTEIAALEMLYKIEERKN